MDPEPKFLFKVTLVGDSQTGKTCTLCQFIKGQLPKVSGPTIGVEFATQTLELKNKECVKLQIWDTAGQERYQSITQAHYRKSLGAMIFFDVTKNSTFQSLPHKIEQIRLQADPGCVIMIVGNKIDLLLSQPDKREVPEDVARSMASEFKCHYMEISALQNQTVREAFQLLAEEMLKAKNITVTPE